MGCITLLMLSMAAPASSQVVVSFTSTGAASAVPLSPWLSAALAVSLAGLGLMLIRRQAGRGVFVLMLSALVGSSALLQASDGYAYGTPTLQTLTGSGAVVTGTTVAWATFPRCGGVGYVWVKGGAGTSTITGISYQGSNTAFNAADAMYASQHYDVTLPTAPAPLCTVGTSLSGSDSCVVWYANLSLMC